MYRIQNLCNYFVTLPSEVAMKLFTVIGNAGESGQQNVIKLHKTYAPDGRQFSRIIVELITGSDPEA